MATGKDFAVPSCSPSLVDYHADDVVIEADAYGSVMSSYRTARTVGQQQELTTPQTDL
jgi:hypothetical protein